MASIVVVVFLFFPIALQKKTTMRMLAIIDFFIFSLWELQKKMTMANIDVIFFFSLLRFKRR
jgi:hypothetical protein